MARSRSQLASAYAPQRPFTFEGGEGACITVAWSGNPDANLKPITERAITEQIQEYVLAWFARGRRAVGLRHTVRPEQAVDKALISGGEVRVRYGDFVFQVPTKVGYVPFRSPSCARSAASTGAVVQ